jgi:hypothetical protein
MFLITYYYQDGESYHYEVVSSIEKWIDDCQKYEHDTYILINVLPISKEYADKWDGNLKSM